METGKEETAVLKFGRCETLSISFTQARRNTPSWRVRTVPEDKRLAAMADRAASPATTEAWSSSTSTGRLQGGEHLRVVLPRTHTHDGGETAAAAEQLEALYVELGRAPNARNKVEYRDGAIKSFSEPRHFGAAHADGMHAEVLALTAAASSHEHRQALDLAAPTAAGAWRSGNSSPEMVQEATAKLSLEDAYAFQSNGSWRSQTSALSPVSISDVSAQGASGQTFTHAYETVTAASRGFSHPSPVERRWRVLGCASPSPSTSPKRAGSPPRSASSAGAAQDSRPSSPSPPRQRLIAAVPVSPLLHPLVSRYKPPFREPQAASSPPRLLYPEPTRPGILSVQDHIALEQRTEAAARKLEGMVTARVEQLWDECRASRRSVLDEGVDLNQLRDELVRGASAEEAGRRAATLRSKMAAMKEAERALFTEILVAEKYLQKMARR